MDVIPIVVDAIAFLLMLALTVKVVLWFRDEVWVKLKRKKKNQAKARFLN